MSFTSQAEFEFPEFGEQMQTDQDLDGGLFQDRWVISHCSRALIPLDHRHHHISTYTITISIPMMHFRISFFFLKLNHNYALNDNFFPFSFAL